MRIQIIVAVFMIACEFVLMSNNRLFSQTGNSEHEVNGTPPNILFIAVDDLKPAIGCYGDDLAITPNMDRLAGAGLTFKNAYCQVAVCNPSRASLMTGLRPDKLGVWTLPIHFREAQPFAVTLPQWFRKHGYTAVSHGKIYHNPTPDPQSWSEPIRSLPQLPYPYPECTRELINAAKERLPNNDWRKNNLRAPCTSSPDLADDQVLDGARTNMAIEDLRRLSKQDEPFFLAMGYVRPHLAFVAPKKYWEMYDAADMPVLSDEKPNANAPKFSLHNNSEFSHYVDLIDMPKPWDEEPLPDETARRIIHGYYACVSYVDAQIGRLLDALEEEGIAENTIVVLWSDHGYKLGNYRGWGKMTNYEIDTRVPLIIATPEMRSSENSTGGRDTEELAELLDLFPTLCDLAGISVPEFIDGKSLLPILENPTSTVHEGVVSQYYRRNDGDELMGYTIRTKTHRMVEWRSFSTGEVVASELYDHQVDPREKHNIAAADSSADWLTELAEELSKTHPRRKLQMQPALHSNPTAGRLNAVISFENQSTTEIAVIPISTKGARVKKGIKKVQPGESVKINSKIGSVFVVESLDGSIHEIHSPSVPTKTVVIQDLANPKNSQLQEVEDLTVAGIFGDGMVLQQQTAAAIWGKASPSAEIQIHASWQKAPTVTTADRDGNWKTTIDTPKAGGPFTLAVQSRKQRKEFNDVLVGEVWICSGQSNMQWKLRGFGVDHFKEDVDKANHPTIRLCQVSQALALKPQEDVQAAWSVCTPSTALEFSAVAYFFGDKLRKELDVPIGLISTSWGGSSAEAWVNSNVLHKEFPEFAPAFQEYDGLIEKHGATHPNTRDKPRQLNQRMPSVLYNQMLRPLVPYSCRGVIWYQGESNVERPYQYRKLFPALIENWREEWGQGDFPFYFVQIAPFHYRDKPLPAALLREAQFQTLKVPNTGMVVTMDVGRPDNIHPKKKKSVGERLALLALARDYGREGLVDSGPEFIGYEVESNQIRLRFKNVGSGLTSRDGQRLSCFTIAGKDQVFYQAEAGIDGETIVVESADVVHPEAVRFGWGNADEPNLMNKEGLPSSSFRTDDWPIEPREIQKPNRTKLKKAVPAKRSTQLQGGFPVTHFHSSLCQIAVSV